MLGFGTVVTQNSDSAFAAMVFLLLGLFLAGCDSFDRMERFLETLLLMFGSFKLIGILQELFPEKAKQLGSLSKFLSKSTATWVFFLIVCMGYIVLLLYRQKHEAAEIIRCGRTLRKIAVIGVVGLMLLFVVTIWANTTGLLQKWFGVSSTGQYLLFDEYWGNSRGFFMEHHGGNVCKAAVVEKAYGRWTGLLFGLLLCRHRSCGQTASLFRAESDVDECA